MKKWLVFLVPFFLVSCGANKVIHFTNSSAIFSAYDTYTLYPSGKVPNTDSLSYFIDQELSRREYKRSSISPDLYVTFEMASSTTTQNVSGGYLMYTPITVSTRNIHELYLIITMKNKKKKLVWQASQKLRKPKSKETQEDVLEESVKFIFNTYLYKAESNWKDESLLGSKE